VRVAPRSWLCGWSGGSSGVLKLVAGMYGGGLVSWSFFSSAPSEGARMWPRETIDLSTDVDDLLRRCPAAGAACGVAIVEINPKGKKYAVERKSCPRNTQDVPGL
jgi:hypothetical protein